MWKENAKRNGKSRSKEKGDKLYVLDIGVKLKKIMISWTNDYNYNKIK